MLNSLLHDAVSRLYPGITLSAGARFLPMLDLARGEISSTAAIEIARAMRENAQAIAKKLTPSLAPHSSGEWRSEVGYLVLAGADALTLVPEALTVAEAFPPAPSSVPLRDVVCLTPDVSSPLYARLRLLALAGLQALLAVSYEGRCRVTAIPDRPKVVASRAEVIEWLRDSVSRVVAEEGLSRPTVEGMLDGVSAGRTTVVTAHHYHDTLKASSKAYLQDLKARDVINLRIPADGWLLSRERALTELLSSSSLRKVLSELKGEDAWMRWLFHAACSTPSGDLDPMVALFDECASPLWSVRTLVQRFGQLAGGIESGVGRDALAAISRLDEPNRALMLRAIFLPMWSARAVAEGEVIAWMSVVEELSARGHALLNRPDTRLGLLKQPYSAELMQILAGLRFGLSSILPVVSEGSCRDHTHTTPG